VYSARSSRVRFPICECIFAFIGSVEDQVLGSFCTVGRFPARGHTRVPGNDMEGESYDLLLGNTFLGSEVASRTRQACEANEDRTIGVLKVDISP
jgi:hypothetical protein